VLHVPSQVQQVRSGESARREQRGDRQCTIVGGRSGRIAFHG
jgi:hypothetical protein